MATSPSRHGHSRRISLHTIDCDWSDLSSHSHIDVRIEGFDTHINHDNGTPPINLMPAGPIAAAVVNPGTVATHEKKLTMLALWIVILEKSADGLGTLAFIWATVVLLGGFAVLLKKVDFWLVTSIVLVEGTRIFSRNHEVESRFFFRAAKAVFRSSPSSSSTFVSRNIRQILTLLQVLAVGACVPLSSMRLIDQNFGEVDEDADKRNLKAALNIFYVLVLAQALLLLIEKAYWGWKIYYLELIEELSKQCGLFEEVGVVPLRRFYHEVYWKCITGSVLDALNMNLVTFAVEQMNSDCHGEQLNGARVLHSFLLQNRCTHKTLQTIRTTTGAVEKLITIMSWKSLEYRDIRKYAAGIVAKLASEKQNVLQVAGIPGAIQSISSLLHTTGRHKRYQESNNELNLLGLLILKKLALDTDNCYQILNDKGLLSTIIEFTRCRHTSPSNDRHQMKILKSSLKLVNRLVSRSGQMGTMLPKEISENTLVVSNIRYIMERSNSNSGLVKIGIEILTCLALTETQREKIGSAGGFIKMLVSIFFETTSEEGVSLRIAAGEALAALAMENKTNCTKILDMPEVVARDLIDMLCKGHRVRITASKIMSNLLAYSGIEYYDRVKEFAAALPSVLKGIIMEEGELLEISIGLSVQICRITNPDPVYFHQLKISKDQLVKKLAEILDKNKYPNIKFPEIRRYVVEQVIWLMESDLGCMNLFRKYNMKILLKEVSDTSGEIDSFKLFSGPVGVVKHERTLPSLVKSALELMNGNSS